MTEIYVDEIEQVEKVTVKISALCSLLDLSNKQFKELVKCEPIVSGRSESLMLLESSRNYAKHLRRIEKTAQKNLERLDSQTALTRQRQKKEEVLTAQIEGKLIPLDGAAAEAKHIGILTRQFCERVVTETVKKVPGKARVKLRRELTQAIDQLVNCHSDRVENQRES